ncbi:unnamed protein product [Chrysoparadoxa australica]
MSLMADRSGSRKRNGGDGWFRAKLVLMVVLVIADVVLNSSVEYDNYKEIDTTDVKTGSSQGSEVTTLVLIVGLQLLVQVAIFLQLFVMMFDTYPFRVGLMGLLATQYKKVYLINTVYVFYTAALHSYRVGRISQESDIEVWEVWDWKVYAAFSIVHKVLATFFYVANIRAAFKLGDPLFYSKEVAITRVV